MESKARVVIIEEHNMDCGPSMKRTYADLLGAAYAAIGPRPSVVK